MGKNQSKIRGMIDNTYKEGIVWSLFVSLFEFFYSIFHKKTANYPNKNLLIEELREMVGRLEPISEVKSQASNEWIKHANQARELILTKDPSMFLRRVPIRDTMNVTNSKFIIEELNSLKKSPDWNSLWKNIIIETKIGGQIPFIFYPKSSGNTIHLTYIISKFEEKTGKNFTDLDFIFEFGGGYGNLCRLIHKLGFHGKYIIFDFPVFSALQEFYLKASELSIYKKNEINSQEKGVFLINNAGDLEALEKRPLIKGKSLFIATWSLSETSLKNRETIWEYLSKFGYFIIGYQNKFGEVNNKKYFDMLKREQTNILWYDRSLKQLPQHNLLIGKVK